MEKLGGGGHLNIAGAQMKTPVEDAKKELGTDSFTFTMIGVYYTKFRGSWFVVRGSRFMVRPSTLYTSSNGSDGAAGGGKGERQVVAAGRTVDVEHLSREV